MLLKKILVVEDELIIGMDIRNSLKKLGYVVPEVISSGEEVVEKIEDFQPDLILMDIMLSGKIDGIQAAEKIRKRFSLPVVYLTANTDAKTLERAKLTEPFGYIVKPFEEKELYTTVEIALARYKAETEVRKALEQEKELNELKSRFITMVSHEFRTPLFTILFSAGLLKKYNLQFSESRKLEHIERIENSAKQMTGLLEDILIMEKAEASQLKLNPVIVDLENFCKEIIEEVEISNKRENQIIFICNFLVNKAYVDEKVLRQILSNLLLNACKYSPNSSKVKFEIICNNEQAIFNIQDEGIGITFEDQKHLFQPFYRGTNVGTISGSGLGLSIVKKAVELYGGQIVCLSEINKGTTFTVALPLIFID